MTDKQTPPDWLLIEAAKRCGGNYHLANLHHLHRDNTAFRALCDALIAECADRIEALTAENERLREALGKVRFLAQVNYEQNDNLNSRGRRDLWRIAECARAALGDTQ